MVESPRRTWRIVTLGCKLNQFDSAAAAGRLGGATTQASEGEPADLVLLNSCTVTHRADRETRRLVRKLKRENPRSTVAVMGCGPKRDADTFRALPEADVVLADPSEVEEFLSQWRGDAGANCSDTPYFAERTRAFLKVQEGCDLRCAYCIVPSVRGASRSVPKEEAFRQLADLLGAGYREVVLTGINTGDWGRDLPGRLSLPDLLQGLIGHLGLPGDFRLRLNSVEPRRVTTPLLDLMAASPRLCRHLQVPLQSGSDAVLEAMKRNYRASFYLKTLEEAASRVPGIALGADVLVGFPTETADDFAATLRLIEASPLAFLHPFSYSSRPGTPAGLLAPVLEREVKARMTDIQALALEKARRFTQGQCGKPLRALALNGGEVLTDNFLTAQLRGESAPHNSFVEVVLFEENGALCAKPLENDCPASHRGELGP